MAIEPVVYEESNTNNENAIGNNASEATDDSESQIEAYKEQLLQLLEECTAKSLMDLRPEMNEDDAFRIRFIDPNQQPIACKSRFLPYHLKPKVKAALDSQLEAGIIRPSKSAWASALHVVHKPDFSIRITIDYKPLNKVILTDQYPIPAITDLFAKLSAMKYFSKIDMKSAYH